MIPRIARLMSITRQQPPLQNQAPTHYSTPQHWSLDRFSRTCASCSRLTTAPRCQMSAGITAQSTCGRAEDERVYCIIIYGFIIRGTLFQYTPAACALALTHGITHVIICDNHKGRKGAPCRLWLCARSNRPRGGLRHEK